MELTAMISALPVEVIAMNNCNNRMKAPPAPRMWANTRAGVRPEPDAAAVMYNDPSSGCVVRARPTKPFVVAMQNGTANQTMPPMRNPRTADLGLADTAL